MKRSILILTLLIITHEIFADINFIDFAKISTDGKYTSAFEFIKDNLEYYDHWTNEWTYNKPKEELVDKLRDDYTFFSSIPVKNTELFLLLGDISHYLYNLDVSSYYESAVRNYDSAIILSPKDYRSYWFLGYHFALSNVPDSAVYNFFKAQTLLPNDPPAEFWNDYAWTSAVTNMPSHCIYAMDKAKNIQGAEGSFQSKLGEVIYKKIVPVDRDSSYKKEDIWMGHAGEMATFISRPLGIKILVDSTWGLTVYDYKNRQTAFILNPASIKDKKGTSISYTIAILMKVANDNQTLDNYINNLISKYSNKVKIPFSGKYESMFTYEIKDKSVYQNIGGGHMYMIGIERNAPKYPGLLLEEPSRFPEGKSGQATFYTTPDYKGRFKGKIFYAILLDSCENIHDQSLAIFKALFENQIIIE